MKQKIATADAPQAIGPYSQAIAAGGLVYCSGQISFDPATGQIVGADVAEQTERVLKNLSAVLKAAGSDTSKVVKCTVFLKFMKDFAHELHASGELVGAEGLASPAQARIVRAGKAGAPEVTDGPFAEAKEFLAGYWIVDCETTERAYEIAARASAAPGPGGKPLNMPIEVREVMSGPPVEV